MKKTNYHSHVELCGHAVGMTEDYVKAAIEYGYTSFGMSDHAPVGRNMMTPEEYIYNWLERQMTYDKFLNVYIPDVHAARDKYKDQINVYCGVETEYLPHFHDYYVEMKSHLDYMNYGAHFFLHNGVITNSFENANCDNILSYAKTVKQGLETKLFETLVHPDVFMYKYRDKNGLNKWDEKCTEASKVIIESAIENDVYLEINCGGLYKVTDADEVVGEFGYPRREFWEIVAKYKEAKVIVGVDAHAPKQLAANEINQAYEFAKKLGIKVLDANYNIEK